MRTIIILFSIIIFSVLLVGCNIKIGDGILTVSEDGVQYVTGDQSYENNDPIEEHKENSIMRKETNNGAGNTDVNNSNMNESHEPTKSPTSNSNVISASEMDELKKIAEELAKIGEEWWGEFSSEEQPNNKSNRGQCEQGINEGYSEIQEKVNHTFYFPPCSHVVSVKEQGPLIRFVLEQRFNKRNINSNVAYVEEMEAIEDAYVHLGGNNIYENYVDYADFYGVVNFYLHGNNRGDTQVNFIHWGDHIEITVTYRHP